MRPDMPRAGPISILRSDYLSNIKQGAINTLSLGCHLFGFGNDEDSEKGAGPGSVQVLRQDQHHLSFSDDDGKAEEDPNLINPSKSAAVLPKELDNDRESHGEQTQKALSGLQAATGARPGTVVKKVKSA